MTDMPLQLPDIKASVLELVDDAVMITDTCLEVPGPRIVYVNSAFADMTGYSTSELVGANPRMLHGPDTDRSRLERLGQALANGDECAGEVINYRRDGEPFLMQWRIRPIRDETGRITHFLSISRDITKERKRDRRHDELEALYEAKRTGRNGVVNEQAPPPALPRKRKAGAGYDRAPGGCRPPANHDKESTPIAKIARRRP